MTAFPERVTLGRSQLRVCPLGISGGYGADKTSLLKAFDRGVNYWYHGSRRATGMNEAVRELVKMGKRDELVFVLQSYSPWSPLTELTLASGLKKLGLEYADVLLLGLRNNPPGEAFMERMMRMREKGLFRHLAISSHKRTSYLGYAGDEQYSILHIRYNAAHPGAERDIFPHIESQARPGTVAFTATRWGTLLKAKRMPEGERPLRGRDCYRFVLSNPDFNLCMSGPKNAAEVDEALAALADGPLSEEEEARIRRIGKYVHDHALFLRK